MKSKLPSCSPFWSHPCAYEFLIVSQIHIHRISTSSGGGECSAICRGKRSRCSPWAAPCWGRRSASARRATAVQRPEATWRRRSRRTSRASRRQRSPRAPQRSRHQLTLRQSKASIDDSVVYFLAMDIPKFNSHSLSRKSKKRRYSTGVDSEKCSLCRYLVIVAFICRSLCRSRSLFSDSTFAIKIPFGCSRERAA